MAGFEVKTACSKLAAAGSEVKTRGSEGQRDDLNLKEEVRNLSMAVFLFKLEVKKSHEEIFSIKQEVLKIRRVAPKVNGRLGNSRS